MQTKLDVKECSEKEEMEHSRPAVQVLETYSNGQPSANCLSVSWRLRQMVLAGQQLWHPTIIIK